MTDTKNTSTDLMAELLDAVGRDVETWDREAEDRIAGIVQELGTVESEYGESPVVSVLTAEGREVRIFGHGTVLRRGIYESEVEPGDLFACRYLGTVTPKSGGKPYHDYSVVVRNGDGTPKGSRPTTAADKLVDDLLPVEPAEEPY